MIAKLTARQQQVLDIIREQIQLTGFPPTRAEIAQAVGCRSANAAEDHLRARERKGAIYLKAGASRGIRLADATASLSNSSSEAVLSLPLVGRVAAGSPILAAQH